MKSDARPCALTDPKRRYNPKNREEALCFQLHDLTATAAAAASCGETMNPAAASLFASQLGLIETHIRLYREAEATDDEPERFQQGRAFYLTADFAPARNYPTIPAGTKVAVHLSPGPFLPRVRCVLLEGEYKGRYYDIPRDILTDTPGAAPAPMPETARRTRRSPGAARNRPKTGTTSPEPAGSLPDGPLTPAHVAELERGDTWHVGNQYPEARPVNAAQEIRFCRFALPAGTQLLVVAEHTTNGLPSYTCYVADGERKGHKFSTTHDEIYGTEQPNQ